MPRPLIAACFLLAMTFAWAAQAKPAVQLSAAEIKAGLRTAVPEENGFVQHVIDMVNQGELPVDLVDSTFQWARKKPQNRFQYFKRALIVRAAKIGINIPS